MDRIFIGYAVAHEGDVVLFIGWLQLIWTVNVLYKIITVSSLRGSKVAVLAYYGLQVESFTSIYLKARIRVVQHSSIIPCFGNWDCSIVTEDRLVAVWRDNQVRTTMRNGNTRTISVIIVVQDREVRDDVRNG